MLAMHEAGAAKHTWTRLPPSLEPKCNIENCQALLLYQHFTDQIETFLEARGFTTGDLVVDELVQQNSEDVYVDDSEDDLSEWQREEMDPDEELNTLMHFVFASDSGTEDLVSPETEVTFTHR